MAFHNHCTCTASLASSTGSGTAAVAVRSATAPVTAPTPTPVPVALQLPKAAPKVRIEPRVGLVNLAGARLHGGPHALLLPSVGVSSLVSHHTTQSQASGASSLNTALA